MAEMIQGQLTIVHTIKEGTPTGKGNPTSAGSSQETPQETPDQKDNITKKGMQDWLGSAAVKRRIANYALSGAQSIVNRNFDERIFNESLYGDRRSMQKIQNQKTFVNGVTTQAKSLVGAGISTVALKNPVIFALALSNVAIGGINAIQNQNMQRRQFEERRSAEMYEANRRRERVNVGVYNRR